MSFFFFFFSFFDFPSPPSVDISALGSDIMSFYKEELEGESVNRVSLLVTCRKRSKIDVLRSVAIEATESHQNALDLLQNHQGATNAYKRYCKGMIDAHLSLGSSRYKLDKLGLFVI